MKSIDKDKILEICLTKIDEEFTCNNICQILRENSDFDIQKIEIEEFIKDLDKNYKDKYAKTLITEKKIHLTTDLRTRKFLENGGFKKIEENEISFKNKNDKKENFEFQLTKWKYYTFWPLFFIALLGGIYGTYDFFKTKNLELRLENIEKALKIEDTKTNK